MKLKIKKGDMVSVISGADKGKTGKILEVITKDMRVLIEGINLRKRHVKPSQKTPQGGMISKERPIHVSKVMLLDQNGKPTRVGIKRVEKGGKTVAVRFAKTTGKELAVEKATRK